MFLAVWVLFLNRLFQKFFDAFEQRELLTLGAKEEASRLLVEASSIEKELEAEIQKTRFKALQENEVLVEEAKKEGVQVTLRKYGLYPGTYYSWKKKLIVEGEEGLSGQATRKRTCQRLAQLEDEVSLLKQLLAEKEMEIALRDELLKKKYPKARKKS